MIGNFPDMAVPADGLHGRDSLGVSRFRRYWNLLAEGLFSVQPERLIRLSRLFFSSFALLAVYLDPTQPARNVEESYSLLIAYVAYAAILALMPVKQPLNSRFHLFSHGIDMFTLTALCLLSEELSSPYWAFVGFLLITSAMRWGFTGALLTAFVMMGLFTIVGWPYYDPTQSDLNGLIMRSSYALVAAVMLGYFASYRERSRRRLAQLADWPIEAAANEGEPWLERSLQHASEVLGGLRLLVIWTDSEEPTGRLAYWDGAQCTYLEVPTEGRPTPHPAEGVVFHQAPLVEATGLPDSFSRNLRLDHISIQPKMPSCCSVSFQTQRYSGQVYVIAPGHPSDDTISLTEIVAGRIAFELEQFALMQDLASTAGWRERGKLARDLHDSVLQDLTAAGLQLKIAAAQDNDTVRASLDDIRKLLQEQQRRIRSFVESSRPAAGQPPQNLQDGLTAFSMPLSSQWHCRLDIAVSPPAAKVNRRLLASICQILSEATANAVRHGKANHLDVKIEVSASRLDIVIADNGAGIASLKEVGETRPQSIRARVADLGGQFQLYDSLPTGLSMRMSLPL